MNNMKKIFLGLAAALMLTACSSDNDDPTPSPNPGPEVVYKWTTNGVKSTRTFIFFCLLSFLLIYSSPCFFNCVII